MKIEDVLSLEEIKIVQEKALKGERYSEVRKLFPRLNRNEVEVFTEYYANLKSDYQSVEMPDYNPEELDELYPQYTWEDLPFDEKAWYNFREKNNFKK